MNSLFDSYDTQLSILKEIDYVIAKGNSPFATDSGYDYDYRGFYMKYGNLSPQATNGHLTDEFKKPNHPTFSNESKYFIGQEWAVRWDKDPYKTLGLLGII